jgi:hypothetical protein
MGRGIGPVCAPLALALALAPGCSRTGLDDTVRFPPAATAAPATDAGSRFDDATSLAGSDDAAPTSSSGGDDGGEFFTSDNDAGDAAGQGTGDCGAANCAGCCTPAGLCQAGVGSSACGHGGQRCMACEPERSCGFQGICQ